MLLRSLNFSCVFLQMYCALLRNFVFNYKTFAFSRKTITMSPYVSVEYSATWTTFIGYFCPFLSLKATVLLHCN